MAGTTTNGQPIRPRWKAAVILGGAAAIIAAGAGFAIWHLLRPAATAEAIAQSFFARLARDDFGHAYRLTSEQFREATNLAKFEAYARAQELNKVSATTWSSRTFTGSGSASRAVLSGEARAADGKPRKTLMRLGRTDGPWRIDFVQVQQSGITSGAVAAHQSIPAGLALVRLVQGSNAVFARAIKAKDMNIFREHVSERWREVHGVDKLNAAFGDFMKAGLDLTRLANVPPVFDGPAKIGPNGALRISGYYDTSPARVTFSHSYIRENGEWKLSGYRLNVRPLTKPSAG